MTTNQHGQRGVLTTASGQKERMPTNIPRRGSRVEPSHVNDRRSDESKDAHARKDAAAEKHEEAKQAELAAEAERDDVNKGARRGK